MKRFVNIMGFSAVLIVFNLVRTLFYIIVFAGSVISPLVWVLFTYEKWNKYTDWLIEDSDEITLRFQRWMSEKLGMENEDG